MDKRIKIIVGTHGFLVRILDDSVRKPILNFAKNLAEFEQVFDPVTKRQSVKVKDVYATASADRMEFGFLLADLKPLTAYLKQEGVSDSLIDTVYENTPTYRSAEIKLKPGVGPRDSEQEMVLEFLQDDSSKNRVVELRTGGGKTACGYMATAHYKRRTAFIMSSTHIATWMRSDWVTDVNFKTEAIMLQGSDSIRAAIDFAAKGEFNYKYVFITLDTYRNYLNDYLETREDYKGITPWNFFEHIGVGIKVVDEAHEKIKASIHTTIYSNVSLVIYLSATLKTDNKKQLEQYLKIFPMADRFKNGRRNDHIQAVSSFYFLRDHRKAKTQGFRGYSHTKYESWLMADKVRTRNYFEFIWQELEFGLFDDYEKGQKALIFFAMTDTCTRFIDWVQPKLKAKGMTGAVFYSGVKESELYEHDVVASTPGSAGTGRDIEDLKLAIATVAISSVQRNLQMLGRPRPLKNYPGKFPYYIWFTCKNIKKHLDYDRTKRLQYMHDVKSITERHTGFIV